MLHRRQAVQCRWRKYKVSTTACKKITRMAGVQLVPLPAIRK